MIVFKTDGMAALQTGVIYAQRIVGEPGDQLRISEGRLSVNDSPVIVRNAAGDIHYANLRFAKHLTFERDTYTVPSQSYFVLGDNSGNSADSRFWGSVPAANILGKAAFIYWPRDRLGVIK